MLILLFFLILLNGFFALAEIAVVSSTVAKIKNAGKQHSKKAKQLLALKEHPDRFLSSVQVGITLIGIISGAIGGLTLADPIQQALSIFNFTPSLAQNIAVVIAIVVVTFFSILMGELTPKSIALSHPERYALAITPVISVIMWIFLPLVRILSFSNKLVLRIIGFKKNKNKEVTESDLLQMLKLAEYEGEITKEETHLHENLFSFVDRKAMHFLTPHNQVISINPKSNNKDIFSLIHKTDFSIYPVISEKEEVHGTVAAKDFYKAYSQNKQLKLQTVYAKPLIIPENINVSDILVLFRQTRTYFSVVVDEYGIIQGILTLHDLVEGIVGNLPDTGEDTRIIKQKKNHYLVKGDLPVFMFNQFFKNKAHLPESSKYATVSGYMVYVLQNVPQGNQKVNTSFGKLIIKKIANKAVDTLLLILKNKNEE